MNTLPLSVIIVNWNSKEYVRACVASIVATTSAIEYEIIVVDSASFDGCGDMLHRLFPQVRFIQSHENLGFGGASNLGARHARGDVLLMLNPDTVVHSNAIEQLYAYVQELPRPGVIGCRLLNTDGSLQSSCVQPFPTIPNQVLNIDALQRWFPKIGLWLTARTFKDAESPVPVDAVSGACMAVYRSVFALVEGFSREYFMYGEDVDLCHKTLAAGLVNYHVPGVQIVHHGGGSTGHSRFSEIMARESVSRLLAKTHGEFYSLGYRLGLTLAAVVRLGILLLIFPAALIRRGTSRWCTAFVRWTSVCRWGIGLENWVRHMAVPDKRKTLQEPD
jgi:GT2 family glycosyltransferase